MNDVMFYSEYTTVQQELHWPSLSSFISCASTARIRISIRIEGRIRKKNFFIKNFIFYILNFGDFSIHRGVTSTRRLVGCWLVSDEISLFSRHEIPASRKNHLPNSRRQGILATRAIYFPHNTLSNRPRPQLSKLGQRLIVWFPIFHFHPFSEKIWRVWPIPHIPWWRPCRHGRHQLEIANRRFFSVRTNRWNHTTSCVFRHIHAIFYNVHKKIFYKDDVVHKLSISVLKWRCLHLDSLRGLAGP